MPDFLAPGVYIEEVSFRPKSIEGVPTNTAGFAGLTRYGPVQYKHGPRSSAPRLITTFTEFERIYGGLEPLRVNGTLRTNYLAYAARAFFENGGKRLYVSRVFTDTDASPAASYAASLAAGMAVWRARWPGEFGNVQVDVRVERSGNLAFRYPEDPGDAQDRHAWGIQVRGVGNGAVVELIWPVAPGTLPNDNAPLEAGRLYVVNVDPDGRQTFVNCQGVAGMLPDDPDNMQVLLLELKVVVSGPGGRVDVYDRLACHKDQSRYIGKVLNRDTPDDGDAIIYLDYANDADPCSAARLMLDLHATVQKCLSGGGDGILPGSEEFEGQTADPQPADIGATGLEALGRIDDIAIVALPDAASLPTPELIEDATRRLIAHAEKYRYRFAVVDGPEQSSISAIREFRGRYDTSHAALYYPWVEIPAPIPTSGSRRPVTKVTLPPCGFICGVYARNDIVRGVHKAPANEPLRGVRGLVSNLDQGQQELLNPEGVNCLRYFKGRGYRVWGARTMSTDPEWKYVNVRRLFIFLEYSIVRSTRWAVFEPNNELLWASIRREVENFLLAVWRDGALLGDRPEQAFFVRCDRSTMTQDDLDNGRLVCLVGVAPTRLAEFVIFRIGQWTADANA